jgi:hypothetical protein
MYPKGKGAITHPGLIWQDQLVPTPLSRNYCTAVTYRFGSAPRTHVLRPSLVELAGGRRIPHLYSQKDQRALFIPSGNRRMEFIQVYLEDNYTVGTTVVFLFRRMVVVR